jgi:membrane protein required for colicin V production
MMLFTIFDILILTIVTVSSLFGLYKGIINITIKLLGFVASIVAAILLYPYTHQIFAKYIENELVSSIVSGVVSYIVSLVVFTFLTSRVELLFKDVGKGFFDRILGGVVGVIRGGLFALIIFTVTAIFTAGTYSNPDKPQDLIDKLSEDKYPDWLKNSITTPYMERMLKSSASLVPEEAWEYLDMSEEKDEDIIETIKKKKSKKKKGEKSALDLDLNFEDNN